MPNHFTTVGLAARDWDMAENKGIEARDVDFSALQGANLCALVMQLPAVFEGIVACSPGPMRYRHKETGEFSKDCNGPSGEDAALFEAVMVSDEEQLQLLKEYGATNWYDWQQNNWGTKWGTYDLEVKELSGDGRPVLLTFQSAWGPPSPAAMKAINEYLREQYYLTNITWIGHDPANGATGGIEVEE